jgi:hypothetical protein
MSPEKTDFNFFAACAPRTLRGFFDTLSGPVRCTGPLFI